jgi:hypothetical protein
MDTKNAVGSPGGNVGSQSTLWVAETCLVNELNAQSALHLRSLADWRTTLQSTAEKLSLARPLESRTLAASNIQSFVGSMRWDFQRDAHSAIRVQLYGNVGEELRRWLHVQAVYADARCRQFCRALKESLKFKSMDAADGAALFRGSD